MRKPCYAVYHPALRLKCLVRKGLGKIKGDTDMCDKQQLKKKEKEKQRAQKVACGPRDPPCTFSRSYTDQKRKEIHLGSTEWGLKESFTLTRGPNRRGNVGKGVKRPMVNKKLGQLELTSLDLRWQKEGKGN
ncbi:Schizosaccharomyces pombe specific protein Mug115 [Schizosaccharomyces pombe]|uniref:Meiotically up-regulated gene 115 protein n=1 Tax=Schizosaccharomyces pombe (strain 972 / ATCC 24843) TaxID=284812 RepID=MU115_SCHPO|nr:protein mug115 [Schizosaccharomyces pombe]Q10262.1 RecName: Full=Meiotically up-regulated gene 115 protein [Schizosaccharomyces pombe 972h-]CAA93585.1 sequence orphan [Schizosaccharomyces pombe]|eukprot:NP_593228.1 protein mug115 [Schizosaccharomyces pombe]